MLPSLRESSSTSHSVQNLKGLLESIPYKSVEVDYKILPGRYCYVTSSPQKWTAFPTKELAANMLQSHNVPDMFTGDDFSKVCIIFLFVSY